MKHTIRKHHDIPSVKTAGAFASSTQARRSCPGNSSTFPSRRIMSVKASAVLPAKPHTMSVVEKCRMDTVQYSNCQKVYY